MICKNRQNVKVNTQTFDEDLNTQVYKLIAKFVSESSYIKNSLVNVEDGLNDLISYAYVHIMENYIPKYNESKGKLSTYVCTTMEYLSPVFINQVRYNTSFNTARAILNNKNSKIRQVCQNIYNSVPIDTCSTEVEYSEDKEDHKSDIDLADVDSDFTSKILDVDRDNYIVKTFNDCVESFVNKHCTVNTKWKTESIIRDYCLSTEKPTYQEIADKYFTSRQRIEQIINKFRRYIKQNKKFRESISV